MAKFSDDTFNNFIKGFFTTNTNFSLNDTTTRVVCLSNSGVRHSSAGYLSLANSGDTDQYLSMSFSSSSSSDGSVSVQNGTGGYFKENKASASYAVDSLQFYYNSKQVSRIFFGTYEEDLSNSNAYINTLIFSGALKNQLSVSPNTTPKIAKKAYTQILHLAGSPVDQGWYEISGQEYVLSTDTTPAAGKTYYRDNGIKIEFKQK